PFEDEAEDQREQRPQYEGRQAYARHRYRHRQVIEPAVLADGGYDTDGDAQKGRGRQRNRAELERDWEAFADDIGHRPVGINGRRSELAAHRIAHRGDEAFRDGPVVAVKSFDLGEDFGADRAFGTERTARRGGDQKEGHGVDA